MKRINSSYVRRRGNIHALIFAIILLFTSSFFLSFSYSQISLYPEGSSWWNTDYNNNEGTDFWVTYMFNSGNLQDDKIDLKLLLYATAREQAVVTVNYADGSTDTINVPAGGRSNLFEVDLNKAYVVNPREVLKKGLYVTSNKKVALYAVNQNSQLGSQDATLVWPTDALHKEYMIQTFGTDGIATEFAIVATKPKLKCKIHIRETHTPTDSIVSERDTVLSDLDEHDVFLLRSRGGEYSLSGSYICSDEPIAVFVGGQYAEVPEKSDPKNHLYAQAMPTDKLGKKFIVPSSKWMKFDYVRLTAVKDNTIVYKNGNEIVRLNQSETYQDTIYNSSQYSPYSAYYSSNEDIVVHQYLTSFAINGDTTGYNQNTGNWQITQSDYGAPALTPITPLEYGMHSVILATFESANITRHFVNIVVHKDGRNNVQLDGSSLSSQLTICADNSDYYFAQIELDNNRTSHIITCSTGSFVATVYGYGKSGTRYESYAYSGGASILHPAWMLIDGQRIRQKTICVNDDVDFESVIEYDHDKPVHWEFTNRDSLNTEEFDGDDVRNHLFPNTGEWEVNMMVTRHTPLCDYSIIDTIKATILVQDTFNIKATTTNGNLRIICQGDVSDTLVNGKTYHYRTSDLQLNKWYTYHDSLKTVADCDSICEIKVLVGEEYKKDTYATLCENELPYLWNTKDNYGSYTKEISRDEYPDIIDYPITKKFEQHLRTIYGCDSLVYLHLTINRVARDTVVDTICYDMQPYEWIDGQGRKIERKHFDILEPSYYEFIDTIKLGGTGCDDIRVLQLIVEPTYKKDTLVRICNGDDYHWEDTILTTSGTYIRKYGTKIFGCDSILTLNLEVGETYNVMDTIIMCERDMPNWKYTISDSHNNTNTWKYNTPLNGKPYETDFKDTLKTVAPFECDSIINLHLKILPTTRKDTIVKICESALPYQLDNCSKVHNAQGTYTDTLDIKNIYGCDSIVNLEIIVQATIETSFTVYWCDNWNGSYSHENKEAIEWQNLTKSGSYPHRFESTSGCDSIVTLHFIVNKHDEINDTIYRCVSDLPYHDVDIDTIVFNAINAKDTTYTKFLKNGFGCDSIVTVFVYVGDTTIVNKEITICESELPWRYEVSDSHGTTHTFEYNTPLNEEPIEKDYTYTLKTIDPFNCDSVINVHLRVLPTTRKDTIVVWCENALPFKLENGTKEFRAEGIHIDTLQIKNMYNCDSVVTINLKIQDIIRTSFEVKWCDNAGEYNYGVDAKTGIEVEEWQHLTEPDDYSHTFESVLGCDSIVTLHFIVNKHDEKNDTIYRCVTDLPYHDVDIDTIVFNAINADDTTYTKFLKNGFGCDSIVTVYVYVGDTAIVNKEFTICESELPWEYIVSDTRGNTKTFSYAPSQSLGGVPYEEDFTYTLTTAKPFSCDSIINVHLKVLPTTYDNRNIQCCESQLPYVLPNGKEKYYESGNYTEILDIVNIYGCDSIVNFHLKVIETLRDTFDVMGCDNELPYNHISDPMISEWQGLDKTGYYEHMFHTDFGCDSIVALHFVVNKHNEVEDTIYRCVSDLPYHDVDIDTIVFNAINANDTTYTKFLKNGFGCDSIVTVNVHVGETYTRDINDTICESGISTWSYELKDSRGKIIKWTYPAAPLNGVPHDSLYTDTLRTISPYECDSVVSLHLRVNPTTYREDYVDWCESAGAYKLEHGTKEYTKSGDYTETLTIPNHYGCDSIVNLHLTIFETIITHLDVIICDNELPYNHENKEAKRLQELMNTGLYYDTLRSSILDCDSIIELNLIVGKTYHVYDKQEICDNETYLFNDSLFSGQAGYYEYDTLLNTIYGCDSLVTLQLWIHPTYRFEQILTTCQDTVNKFTWKDQFGGIHSDIDISKPGDYTIYDTLVTIHGCDSLFGLRLHIDPIYRFDSIYTACDNESISWQGRIYKGNKLDSGNGLPAGIYYDKVEYVSSTGCDSTFYLTYIFHPTYDTIVYDDVCYDGTNGLPYEWTTYDNFTKQEKTNIISIDEFEDVNATKNSLTKEFTILLKTTQGCDSLVRLQLSVHPTYRFVTDTTICSNEYVEWHGKRYRTEGVYYDSLQTINYGCDSIYELRLKVKPAYDMNVYLGKRCDNTYYVRPDQNDLWSDTIFFYKDTINFRPDELRDEIYVRQFYTEEGCDSVYRIHVTVCPTFDVTEPRDTICSNELYYWHGGVYELPIGLNKLDTTFYTIYGCDSTFSRDVYVKQAYHFYETDSICQNEQLEWQHRTIKDLSVGLHQFDTTYLTWDGCDSTYTIYLTVFEVYHVQEEVTICDDESYLWQTREITLPAGVYHFDTLYTTIHGCDSIFELDLTINPVTEETRYDTICQGDWYELPNYRVNETGYYEDVTLNEYGCKHYIYLNLFVVPPTRLSVSIGTICADEKSFEIVYRYTGTEPIEYSVVFDSLGLSQGFEDIIHEPIIDLEDSIIVVEIPYGDVLPMPGRQYYDGVSHQFTSERKHAYVRPDVYPITVYLHNAFCADDSLALAHVDALIQYPHWIHEQHWNDAIVLYKDTFNGGYDFTHYQWYENGEPIDGEIGDYLYLPHNLNYGSYYQVKLTRSSDGKTFMTCPITPAFDVDSIVPTMYYFSVVPTLVYGANPHVSILCNIGGYFDVISSQGNHAISHQRFEPQYDASILETNPELPANVMKDDVYFPVGTEGLYLFRLTADNGEQRTIKVLVTNEY